MSGIEKIDKNFKIETSINKSDVKFYDPRISPFEINGVFYEKDRYRRMPESVAKAVSAGVYALHANTAGGRVRFKTDSAYVAINARMSNIVKMSHFALCGSTGFDLYEDGIYKGTFRPPFDIDGGFESVVELEGGKMREIAVNMPLYCDVNEVYIGLQESAKIDTPTPYVNEKPVVYYGSSVTQGGCASRAGTSYQGFISRELNIDFVNLGFSGSAHAEDAMSDYISSLDMSVFVYDYDHNAPSYEHLEKTHEKMFLRIRESHPTLPIIMTTMPKHTLTAEQKKRRDLIESNYLRAKAKGDENVYFIEGTELLSLAEGEGTVDTTHPTDLGFFSMAKIFSKTLRQILKL